MADAELAIVVRVKDQLSAALRQMGTSVEQLAKEAADAFGGSATAAQRLRTETRNLASSFGVIGPAAKEAGAQATSGLSSIATASRQAIVEFQRLGQAPDLSKLRAEIAGANEELARLKAREEIIQFFPGQAEKVERLTQEIIGAEQVLRTLQATGERIDIGARIAQAQQAFAALGANASLAPLEAEVVRGRAELERLRVSATLAGGAISQLDRQRLDQLDKEVTEGTLELQRLRVAAEQVKGAGAQIGPAFASSRSGVSSLTGSINTLKSALLPILPILTLAGAAYSAVRSVNEARAFADSLSDIRAQSELTERELSTLRSGALATTRALGLQESKEGAALLQAVTDGAKDAAEGLAIFTAAARLGVAANGETAKGTEILTAALKAYRAENLQAADAADQVFATIKAADVELDDLAGTYGRILPLAAGLGISFGQVNAALAATRKGGAEVEQAFTGLRATLTAMLNVSKGTSDEAVRLRNELAEQGISFDAQTIKSRGLVAVLQDVERAYGGNSEALNRIFPDGRSFGALLAALADGGANLTTSLRELESASGGVERALGKKLQDPATQIGILFNRLRSEFSQTFGGAFLASIQNAVESMGGVEEAARTVGDVARNLGLAFGSALPGIIQGLTDAGKAAADFLSKLDGTEFQRFASFGVGAARAVGTAFAALVQEIDLVKDLIASFSGITLFSNLDQSSIDRVGAALTEVEEGLRRIESGREGKNGIALFNEENLVKAVNALPIGGGRVLDIEAKLRAPNVQQELEKIRDDLRKEKVEVEAIVNGDRGIDELKRRWHDAISEFKDDGEGIRASLETSFAEVGAAFSGSFERGSTEAQRSLEQVRAELDFVNASIRDGQDLLAKLGQDTRDAFDFTQGDVRAGFLQDISVEARLLRDALDGDREAAAGLKDELAQFTVAEITRVEGEIRKLESGLHDTRSEAELLGLTDPGEIAVAMEALGQGAEFSQGAISKLRDELDTLRAKLREIRGEFETFSGETVRLSRVGRVELADVLDFDTAAFARDLKPTIASLGSAIQSALARGDGITAEALFSRRERAELLLQARQTAEQFVGEFTTLDDLREKVQQAVSFDVPRGANASEFFAREREEAEALIDSLIDVSKERGRFIGDSSRARRALVGLVDSLQQTATATRIAEEDARHYRLALVRFPSAITTEIVLNGITAAVAGLEALSRERKELQGQAIGLEVEFDGKTPTAALGKLIEEARRELDKERLALVLGVEVDAASIERAQQDIADASAGAQRSGLEREALHFGVSIDSKNLEADIIRAREEAQAFADALADKGVRREAIALGIALDQKSIDELERDIASVRDRAQEFASSNPIAAEALTQGVRGLSSAIGQIASGAQSAKDALANFARSTVQHMAEVIAQMLIVKTLIAALGGVGTGPGAFLASAFGVAGARGLTFKGYARGGAFARDPIAQQFRDGGVPVHVQAFAKGGIPRPDRLSSASYPHPDRAPIAPYVREYAKGGLPGQQEAIRRTLPSRHGHVADTPQPRLVREYAKGGVPSDERLSPSDQIRRVSDGPRRVSDEPQTGLRRAPPYVREYAMGGVPGTDEPPASKRRVRRRAQRIELPPHVEEFAKGGRFSGRGRGPTFTDSIAASVVRETASVGSRTASVARPQASAGVREFAVGDRFTTRIPRNQITRSPTLAPLARFGEAGPEAIMPLSGALEVGVRQAVAGSAQSTNAARAFLRSHSIPLARDARGRLGVQGFAVEDLQKAARRFALGEKFEVPFARGGARGARAGGRVRGIRAGRPPEEVETDAAPRKQETTILRRFVRQTEEVLVPGKRKPGVRGIGRREVQAYAPGSREYSPASRVSSPLNRERALELRKVARSAAETLAPKRGSRRDIRRQNQALSKVVRAVKATGAPAQEARTLRQVALTTESPGLQAKVTRSAVARGQEAKALRSVARSAENVLAPKGKGRRAIAQVELEAKAAATTAKRARPSATESRELRRMAAESKPRNKSRRGGTFSEFASETALAQVSGLVRRAREPGINTRSDTRSIRNFAFGATFGGGSFAAGGAFDPGSGRIRPDEYAKGGLPRRQPEPAARVAEVRETVRTIRAQIEPVVATDRNTQVLTGKRSGPVAPATNFALGDAWREPKWERSDGRTSPSDEKARPSDRLRRASDGPQTGRLRPFALGGAWEQPREVGKQPTAPTKATVRAIREQVEGPAAARRPHALAETTRSIRTTVKPYELGGVPDMRRALWTAPMAFEAGGVADIKRTVSTIQRQSAPVSAVPGTGKGRERAREVPFLLGGIPDLRSIVQPFAAGGAQDARSYAPGATPRDLRRTISTVAYEPVRNRTQRQKERTTARKVAEFASGGLFLDLTRSARTAVQPFAMGAVQDARRAVRTDVVPFSAGSRPSDMARSLRTSVKSYALGGIPNLSRVISTEVRPFALGGVRDATRNLRTLVQPFGMGGSSDEAFRPSAARSYADVPSASLARALVSQKAPTAQTSARSVAVSVNVPLTVNFQGSAEKQEEAPEVFSRRLQAAMSRNTNLRELIAGIVAAEIDSRPSYRGSIRGDRV